MLKIYLSVLNIIRHNFLYSNLFKDYHHLNHKRWINNIHNDSVQNNSSKYNKIFDFILGSFSSSPNFNIYTWKISTIKKVKIEKLMANNWRESNLDFLHAGENSLQWKRNEEREEYDILKKRNFISKCKERKKKKLTSEFSLIFYEGRKS